MSQTPLDSFRFLKDTLIHISEDGKTRWILKDRNEVHEVNLPSVEMKNKISLNFTSESYSNQTLVNFQISDMEIYDSKFKRPDIVLKYIRLVFSKMTNTMIYRFLAVK